MTEEEEDLRRMSSCGWRMKTKDRQDWRRIVEEAKVHIKL